LDESRDSMVRTASGPGAPREDLLRLWRAGALGYRPSLKSPEWVRPENDARGEDLLEIVDASLDVLSLGACREGPASRHRRSSAALIAQVFADGETPVETNRLKDHAPHARRWRLILIRIMDTEMSQCAAEMAYLEFRRHWSDLRADHPPPELCVECAEGEGALMELLGHVRSERGRPFIE